MLPTDTISSIRTSLDFFPNWSKTISTNAAYSIRPQSFELQLTDYLIEDTSGFHAGVPASTENAIRVLLIPIFQK